MGGSLDNRCVGRVYGADGAVQHPHRTHDLRSNRIDPTKKEKILRVHRWVKAGLD